MIEETIAELTASIKALTNAVQALHASAPVEQATPAPVAEPASPAPAPVKTAEEAIPYTLDEVRGRLVSAGIGRDGIVELLGQFGVNKLSDLPAAEYPALMKLVDAA